MKKLIALALVLVLSLTLASALAENKKIVIGATPSPHVIILEQIVEDLKALGYDLEIQTFTEYPIPNPATAAKELDANYFQHLPYLEDFNKEQGTHIVSIATIHVEPMGLYGGKQTSLDALTK